MGTRRAKKSCLVQDAMCNGTFRSAASLPYKSVGSFANMLAKYWHCIPSPFFSDSCFEDHTVQAVWSLPLRPCQSEIAGQLYCCFAYACEQACTVCGVRDW